MSKKYFSYSKNCLSLYRRLDVNLRGNQQGTTIIELLIALAIFAFISAIIWGFSYQIRHATTTTTNQTSRYRCARAALAQIEKDLSMAFLSRNESPEDRSKSRFRTFFDGKQSSDIDALAFSYFGHQVWNAAVREADTAVVVYSRGEESKGENKSKNTAYQLLRSETKYLQPEVLENIPKTTDVLCDNVVRLEFKYYHPDQKVWLANWNTTKLDGFQNRLPSMVQINLTFLDAIGDEILLQSMVRLWML